MDAQAVEVEFGDGAGDRNGAGGVEGREFGYFVVMFLFLVLGVGVGGVGEVGFVMLWWVRGPGGRV